MAIFFLLQPAPLSAASPLAMRVDVQPAAVTADGTVMTIEVQLAPQDRGRIGRQARMRVKLNRGSKTLHHILSDIDFDTEGTTRVEYTWPPGSYELTLTIESLRGGAQGLWAGQVDVPESLDRAPAPAPPEPKVETPAEGPSAPSTTSSPVATAAVTAAPVVAPAPPPPESPATATEKAAPAASTAPTATDSAVPEPSPPQASATTPSTPEPPDPVPAAAPSPAPAPAAEPTQLPQVRDEVPAPQPVATPAPRADSPVYALVLDIDSSDLEIADRAADLEAAIGRRVENVTPIIIKAGDSNPTLAISRALDLLRPHSEARFITVITDVRRKASRSEWKKAAASVQDAGIPVFVIALWNDRFNPGTRKQFKRLTTDSGGRSYLLQPSESPARALEMFESALNPSS